MGNSQNSGRSPQSDADDANISGEEEHKHNSTTNEFETRNDEASRKVISPILPLTASLRRLQRMIDNMSVIPLLEIVMTDINFFSCDHIISSSNGNGNGNGTTSRHLDLMYENEFLPNQDIELLLFEEVVRNVMIGKATAVNANSEMGRYGSGKNENRSGSYNCNAKILPSDSPISFAASDASTVITSAPVSTAADGNVTKVFSVIRVNQAHVDHLLYQRYPVPYHALSAEFSRRCYHRQFGSDMNTSTSTSMHSQLAMDLDSDSDGEGADLVPGLHCVKLQPLLAHLSKHIVGIALGKGAIIGTGLLIASNLVLIARHVLEGIKDVTKQITVRLHCEMVTGIGISLGDNISVTNIFFDDATVDCAVLELSQPMNNEYEGIKIAGRQNGPLSTVMFLHHANGSTKRVSIRTVEEELLVKDPTAWVSKNNRGAIQHDDIGGMKTPTSPIIQSLGSLKPPIFAVPTVLDQSNFQESISSHNASSAGGVYFNADGEVVALQLLLPKHHPSNVLYQGSSLTLHHDSPTKDRRRGTTSSTNSSKCSRIKMLGPVMIQEVLTVSSTLRNLILGNNMGEVGDVTGLYSYYDELEKSFFGESKIAMNEIENLSKEDVDVVPQSRIDSICVIKKSITSVHKKNQHSKHSNIINRDSDSDSNRNRNNNELDKNGNGMKRENYDSNRSSSSNSPYKNSGNGSGRSDTHNSSNSHSKVFSCPKMLYMSVEDDPDVAFPQCKYEILSLDAELYFLRHTLVNECNKLKAAVVPTFYPCDPITFTVVNAPWNYFLGPYLEPNKQNGVKDNSNNGHTSGTGSSGEDSDNSNVNQRSSSYHRSNDYSPSRSPSKHHSSMSNKSSRSGKSLSLSNASNNARSMFSSYSAFTEVLNSLPVELRVHQHIIQQDTVDTVLYTPSSGSLGRPRSYPSTLWYAIQHLSSLLDACWEARQALITIKARQCPLPRVRDHLPMSYTSVTASSSSMTDDFVGIGIGIAHTSSGGAGEEMYNVMGITNNLINDGNKSPQRWALHVPTTISTEVDSDGLSLSVHSSAGLSISSTIFSASTVTTTSTTNSVVPHNIRRPPSLLSRHGSFHNNSREYRSSTPISQRGTPTNATANSGSGKFFPTIGSHDDSSMTMTRESTPIKTTLKVPALEIDSNNQKEFRNRAFPSPRDRSQDDSDVMYGPSLRPTYSSTKARVKTINNKNGFINARQEIKEKEDKYLSVLNEIVVILKVIADLYQEQRMATLSMPSHADEFVYGMSHIQDEQFTNSNNQPAIPITLLNPQKALIHQTWPTDWSLRLKIITNPYQQDSVLSNGGCDELDHQLHCDEVVDHAFLGHGQLELVLVNVTDGDDEEQDEYDQGF